MKAFTDHPRSVGETYLQHMGASLSFALSMQIAAIAALIHSALPFLCTRTGSQIVTKLHDRMVANRQRHQVQGQLSQFGPGPARPRP